MRRTAVIVAFAMLAACKAKRPPSDADGVYRSAGLKFKHGELPAGWVRTSVDGTALAFDNRRYGATITASSNCKDIEDVSLRALVQQELVGVEKKEIVERSEEPVADREAADWVVKGALDGVAVEMELVVLRTGKCVYDMVLVSDPEMFESARPDFRAFVSGFEVLK